MLCTSEPAMTASIKCRCKRQRASATDTSQISYFQEKEILLMPRSFQIWIAATLMLPQKNSHAEFLYLIPRRSASIHFDLPDYVASFQYYSMIPFHVHVNKEMCEYLYACSLINNWRVHAFKHMCTRRSSEAFETLTPTYALPMSMHVMHVMLANTQHIPLHRFTTHTCPHTNTHQYVLTRANMSYSCTDLDTLVTT